ncbi:hypothetical protein DRW07_07870 [Alteromonas sediminis]|uniref:Uncharacterized protein n=1 Tax=Alteromonas sediminis TaxID=2259342 RepID=A0A3N5Y8L1_9ALTE|nr:hypothetical protein [Alteromonas sediminis]RPJ67429.1 hypothetical protein DRW07_07870 [Alteromonas sediminis]
MVKKASLYLWLLVIAYVGLIALSGESVAGRTLADNFGMVFFGAVGAQILIFIVMPFMKKK